ncbi:MAG: hypothetical protein J0L53_06955, partial [Spirochaetes bacterium]|nr:hypothetical protein [Spirochaetota bacterium]
VVPGFPAMAGGAVVVVAVAAGFVVAWATATAAVPIAALKAGADVLLYTSWQEEPIEGVKRIAAEFGALPRANAEKKTEASTLERAARNQLRAKLPYLKIENYLPGDEAAWYRDYDKALQTKRTQQPVAHDPETLKKKYADIRWSAKQKRNQPQWLAGQKNQAN